MEQWTNQIYESNAEIEYILKSQLFRVCIWRSDNFGISMSFLSSATGR